MKHYGYTRDGKLHADSFKEAVRGFVDRGVPVVLTVKEFKPNRSSQQNRYYFGVVVKLIGEGLKDLGWEPKECTGEAVHEMMKREFLTVDKHLKDGLFVRHTRSTTDLDSMEFGAYVDHCIRWAAENLGVVVPPAGEQVEMIEV